MIINEGTAGPIYLFGTRKRPFNIPWNELMIEGHDKKRSVITKSSTSSKFTIRVRGKLPTDLKQRVSAIHAMAILKTVSGFKRLGKQIIHG